MLILPSGNIPIHPPFESSRTASRMLIAGCFTAAAAQVVSGLLLYRYGGLQQIWAAADTAAVNDPPALVSCLRAGFEEIVTSRGSR